jgi:hypothetical protein
MFSLFGLSRDANLQLNLQRPFGQSEKRKKAK